MALFLLRFWPALIPTLLYVVWLLVMRSRARKKGEREPHFRDGPVYWLVIISLAIAAVCFVATGISHDAQKGNYQPPHMENGVLIPSKVSP